MKFALRSGAQTNCYDDGEAVGRYIEVELFGFILMLCTVRRERRLAKRELRRTDYYGRRVPAPWWARLLHRLGWLRASR